MNKAINKRIKLEKKYCDICLYNKIPLNKMGNRVLSVSPGNFYYVTGINASRKDIEEYKRLSEKAHFGERLQIENEVENIIDWKILFPKLKYFFEAKNILIELSLDDLNKLLIKSNIKTLRLYKFNRLKRLLRKWTVLSTQFHLKIKGAKKRLHRKYSRRIYEI